MVLLAKLFQEGVMTADLTLIQVRIWQIQIGGNRSQWYLYQHDTGRWSIRDGLESRSVITRSGELMIEPGWSNRDDDFQSVFRFPTQESALAVLRKCLESEEDCN